MEKIHNKLVRDLIPEIIEKNGETPTTRILDDKEYREELYKKLQEECTEAINATNKDDSIEELADVLEVIRAISILEGESIDKVIETADKKRKKRGGFGEKIYLISTK